jgi:hypothetical protein
VSTAPERIVLPTRRLDPAVVDVLKALQPGQRIVITQTVRVGGRKWATTTKGTFRGINYLATGLSTERVAEDDLVVPMVHFTKDNGELSSITIDENSRVERE